MNYKDILRNKYFIDAYSKIEELKKDYYVNHGFVHIDGVIKSAGYLADLFGLTTRQKELLMIASALHDVGYLMGRENHAENGGELVREFLKDKMPAEEVDIICHAISCHGGKREEDFLCPVSKCLVLADKFDFSKVRYKDDGKEHKNLPLFKSIERVQLRKENEMLFKLEIHTTNASYFDDIEHNAYFQKLKEVFERLKNASGEEIEFEVVAFEKELN